MKNILSISTLIIFLITMGCNEHAKHSEKKDHDNQETTLPAPNKSDVENIVKQFNEALVNPTVEKLNKLCADNLSYGHSSGLVQNKEVFVNDVVNGSFDYLSVDAPEQSIVLSGDTAIVRNIFLSKASNKGEAIDIRLGCVQVYKRGDDGSWKMLMRQAFKL